MRKLRTIIDSAEIELRTDYAKMVLHDWRRWSGADLRGKASRYPRYYARQRSLAANALYAAGGIILSLSVGGRLVTACYLGMSDYGDAIYDTTQGVAVTHRKTVKLI